MLSFRAEFLAGRRIWIRSRSPANSFHMLAHKKKAARLRAASSNPFSWAGNARSQVPVEAI
jgi:hypothetical protein